MTRICENCEYVNQDDYDFCAKCGTPLVEGLNPKQVYVYRGVQPQLNKNAIIIAYILTIILSWGGFVWWLATRNTAINAFTFFGLFMPFYLIQAPIRELRKHGIILLFISLAGVILSFYVIMK